MLLGQRAQLLCSCDHLKNGQEFVECLAPLCFLHGWSPFCRNRSSLFLLIHDKTRWESGRRAGHTSLRTSQNLSSSVNNCPRPESSAGKGTHMPFTDPLTWWSDPQNSHGGRRDPTPSDFLCSVYPRHRTPAVLQQCFYISLRDSMDWENQHLPDSGRQCVVSWLCWVK